ncbi:MAG: hypothetical protein ABSB95_04150 [Dissulfurispiraceae bacterium]|jgi:hypothetical protein
MVFFDLLLTVATLSLWVIDLQKKSTEGWTDRMKERRDAKIQIRLSEKEREGIESQAKGASMTVSEWMRYTALHEDDWEKACRDMAFVYADGLKKICHDIADVTAKKCTDNADVDCTDNDDNKSD